MADDSIWKKEISFGRKRKDAEQPQEQSGDEPTSIWKKEISLGRKKNAEPEQEPAVAAEPVEEPVADEEPAWTRAVSFGRKAEPDPEPAAEEPAPPEEETWTRAVSFNRKSEPESPATEPAAPELVVVPPVPVADADELEPVEVTQPEPVAAAPEPVDDEPPAQTWSAQPTPPPVEPEPLEVQQPEPVAAAPEPVDDEPPAQTWSAQPAPPPVDPEPVELTRPEPLVAVPEPVEDEAPAQTWSAQPAPPPVEPAPVAAPPAVDDEAAAPAPVVQAPMTAGELPPVEDDDPGETKVPFWKKEIGGKKKDETPKKEKVQVLAAAAVVATEADKKVPFWKKEIGGKKKDRAPKQKVETVATSEAPAPEPETDKKAPFWKKEIGGRKDKAPKAERAPKGPKEKKQKQPRQPKVKAARGSRGAKRITGLKIGASQLAAARVANNGSAELLQVARTPLEPGIVVGGELRDPDALAEALKDFFAKNNLPKKGVRLGIANNRIGVRTFEIAGVGDEKQLTNAIRFRAQETLPIPIDEAVLDYQVLGDGTGEDGQPTKRVLLVVAYRDLVDRYVDACKKAGISLIGIDLEAFALLRALQAPQDGGDVESDSALVAVAIGHDRSTFAVSDGRVCEFTRVLEWGGSALNVALARALDAAPSEVDTVKRALALTDEMVPDGLTAEQAQKARDSMRRAIQTFARELVSSLQYYQNQPGSLGIGEIVLTGGTAHLAGLAGELERLIGVRVRVGDPLGRMKVSKKVGEAEQVGSLAVAIGLGIED
jgi:type IV pilus assembly protein PilM